jgi:hypothetical protein
VIQPVGLTHTAVAVIVGVCVMVDIWVGVGVAEGALVTVDDGDGVASLPNTASDKTAVAVGDSVGEAVDAMTGCVGMVLVENDSSITESGVIVGVCVANGLPHP